MRDLHPVQTSATHDRSLEMRLGQRFESARRLSFFLAVRWEISANDDGPSRIPAAGFVQMGQEQIASCTGHVSPASSRAIAQRRGGR